MKLSTTWLFFKYLKKFKFCLFIEKFQYSNSFTVTERKNEVCQKWTIPNFHVKKMPFYENLKICENHVKCTYI